MPLLLVWTVSLREAGREMSWLSATAVLFQASVSSTTVPDGLLLSDLLVSWETCSPFHFCLSWSFSGGLEGWWSRTSTFTVSPICCLTDAGVTVRLQGSIIWKTRCFKLVSHKSSVVSSVMTGGWAENGSSVELLSYRSLCGPDALLMNHISHNLTSKCSV